MHLSFMFSDPIDSKLWIKGTNENTRRRCDRRAEVAQTEAQNAGSQMQLYVRQWFSTHGRWAPLGFTRANLS